MTTELLGSEIIFAYTRAQALADGEQVNVGELYPRYISRFRFAFPIFANHTVWGELVSGLDVHDAKTAAWAILAGLAKAIAQLKQSNGSSDQLVFTVERPAALSDAALQSWPRPKYALKAMVGPTDIDNPAPAITLMWTDED